MAKIYHYTSIEALALILKNETIRFNRLDQVDDEEESIFGSGEYDVKIGKYIFVSCWTKDPEENPELWAYVGEKGVRIAIDENMFRSYSINENFEVYFPHQVEIVDDCFFLFTCNPVKLFDINYVDDNEERIKKLIDDGRDLITIKIEELGIYKNKYKWEKQKESRFRLVAL